MKNLLAAVAAVICMCVTYAKAETLSSSCASLGLLTFPGNNGIGSIVITGAFPGDVLLSVQSITINFWTDEWVKSFAPEVGQVPVPNPTAVGPAIFQNDGRNLSTATFIALVCRKH